MFVYKVKLEQPRKGGKTFNLPTFHFHLAPNEEAVKEHFAPRFVGYRITIARAAVSDLTGNLNHQDLLIPAVEV